MISLVKYFSLHLSQIKQGGLRIVARKTTNLSLIPIAVILTVIVRILSPICLIRIGTLRSNRIGHFTVNTELYLAKRKLCKSKPLGLDIFYLTEPISNKYLGEMWKRLLRINSFAKHVDRINRNIPGHTRHQINLPSDIDNDGILSKTLPQLKFSSDEEILGQKLLQEMGIPAKSPFVCFQSRDSSYLKSIFNNHDYTYHTYRDSKISNCIPAAEALTKRGYYAIRTGYNVKDNLDSKQTMIIDYANEFRSEFMDIYLASKCSFYFGGGPGNVGLFAIFRKALARVNVIPYAGVVSWNPTDIFIPKKLWLNSEHRYMTFKEIFDSNVKNYNSSEDYHKNGITVTENSASEIQGLAIEMDDRIKGRWKDTKENQELQSLFWSLFKSNEQTRIKTRIGTDFLKNNTQLME